MSTELYAVAVANPFGGPVTTASPPTASAAALAQREVAEVQAAMAIAKRFPRDPKEAVDRILNACTRPGLAEKALYQYARGGQDVTGPSIRLAEELARGWGNLLTGVTELSRSNGVSECLAYCWDLETNYRDEKRFQVRHWRDTKKGGYQITDERDIYELIANMGARRKRACILAVIPGDVQEAATQQCDATMRIKAEVTPERILGMLERFADYGVTKDMIEARIQRRMDAITPAMLVNLGKIYNSLKDGMSKAADWFEMPQAVTHAGATSKLDALADVAEKLPETAPPAGETAAPTETRAEPEPQPTAPANVQTMDYEEAVATLGMAETVIDLNAAKSRLEGFTWSLDERAGIDEVYNDRLRELKRGR